MNQQAKSKHVLREAEELEAKAKPMFEVIKKFTEDNDISRKQKEALSQLIVRRFTFCFRTTSNHTPFPQITRRNEVHDIEQMNATDRGRLVQSPERIKRSIHDMAANAESTKPQIAHYDATARVLQAKLDFLHDFRNVIIFLVDVHNVLFMLIPFRISKT